MAFNRQWSEDLPGIESLARPERVDVDQILDDRAAAAVLDRFPPEVREIHRRFWGNESYEMIAAVSTSGNGWNGGWGGKRKDADAEYLLINFLDANLNNRLWINMKNTH